jgi:hypothetical protein
MKAELSRDMDQLEMAIKDVQVIIDMLDEPDSGGSHSPAAEFYEARADIECELYDLVGDNKSFDKLLKEYYKADLHLDKALKAYMALHNNIKKVVDKL